MKKIKILKKYIFLIFLLIFTFFFFSSNANNQEKEKLERQFTSMCSKYFGQSYSFNANGKRQFICRAKDEKITIKNDYLNIYYQETKKEKLLLTSGKTGIKFFYLDLQETPAKIILIDEETLLKKIIDYYNLNNSDTLEEIDKRLNVVKTLEGNKIIEIKYFNWVFNLRDKSYFQIGKKIERENKSTSETTTTTVKKVPSTTTKTTYKLTEKEIKNAKDELKKIQKEKSKITLNSNFEFESKNFKFLSNDGQFKMILSAKKKNNNSKYTLLYSQKDTEIFFLNNQYNVIFLTIQKTINIYKNIFINVKYNTTLNNLLLFRKTFNKIVIVFYLDKNSKKLKKIDFWYNGEMFKEFIISKASLWYSWNGKTNNNNTILLKLYEKLNKWLVVALGSGGGVIFLCVCGWGYKKFRDNQY